MAVSAARNAGALRFIGILFFSSVLAGCFVVTNASATTYSWTGDVDGDWTKAGNWDSNGVPVDTGGGDGDLELNGSTSRIVFDASASSNPVPTNNIPIYGGNAFANTTQDTPEMDLLFGTMSVPVAGWGQGLVKHPSSEWTTTVGDGDISNGLAVLNYNMTPNQIHRDPGGTMDFTVEADGELKISNPGNPLDFSYGDGRFARFFVGGKLTFTKAILLDGYSGNYFVFKSADANMTAALGGSFPNLSAVEAAIGQSNSFRIAESGLDDDVYLVAATNAGSTFTVTLIDPPPAGTVLIVR